MNPDLWDILVALGVVLVGIGLAMLAPWLGVTVAGVMVLAIGIIGSLSETPTAAEPETDGA